MTKIKGPKGRKGGPTAAGAQQAGHAKKMAKKAGKGVKTKHAIMAANKVKTQSLRKVKGRTVDQQLGSKSGKARKKELALRAAYERRRGELLNAIFSLNLSRPVPQQNSRQRAR